MVTTYGLFKEGGEQIFGDISGCSQISKEIDAQSIILYLKTQGEEIILGTHLEERTRKARLMFIEHLSSEDFFQDPYKAVTEFFTLADAAMQEKNLEILGMGNTLVPYPAAISPVAVNSRCIQDTVASILVNQQIQVAASPDLNVNISFLIGILNEIRNVSEIGFSFCVSDINRSVSKSDVSIRATCEKPDIDLQKNASCFSADEKDIASEIISIFQTHILKPVAVPRTSSRGALSDTIFRQFLRQMELKSTHFEGHVQSDRFGTRIFLELLKLPAPTDPKAVRNYPVLYQKFDTQKKRAIQNVVLGSSIYLEEAYRDAIETIILKNDIDLFLALQNIDPTVFPYYKQVLENTCNRIRWDDPQVQQSGRQILVRCLNGPLTKYSPAQKHCLYQVFTRLKNLNALDRTFLKKYRNALEAASIIPPIKKGDIALPLAREALPLILTSVIGIVTGYLMNRTFDKPEATVPALATGAINATASTMTPGGELSLMGYSLDLDLILFVICLLVLILVIAYSCYRKIDTY